MSQYIYSNRNDTLRVNIFKIEEGSHAGEWDCDVFCSDGNMITMSPLTADTYGTRREAKSDMCRRFGNLTSINPKGTITAGWDDVTPDRHDTPDGFMAKNDRSRLGVSPDFNG